MNNFFKRLPLRAKLMLIGLIPFCFFAYLTQQVYKEKTQRLQLYNNYRIYIAESADINKLIESLQEERKYSFDYAITKNKARELNKQRPQTDTLIKKIIRNDDPSLEGFTGYTKLKLLPDIRKGIDSFISRPNDVMHFYSTVIFRLNTLNTIPPGNTAYLQPIYKDLMVQKILSEMITYLSIIRSNIYNVLHTRQYMIETMVGTVGTHEVYNSYEEELLVKATPGLRNQYQTIRHNTALQPTIRYIDTVFRRFSFDSSYNAAGWWKLSDQGVNELRKFQTTIWEQLNTKLDKLYAHEKNARDRTLVILIITLISVILVIAYIVNIITHTLKGLQVAAEKIANGETGIRINAESNDAIGSLAKSISRIDKNNQALANATVAIGKGNFEVEIESRSKDDLLGNAIIQMKTELQQYSEKMEELVALRTEELARSNEDLQQFAHVASHDLKEPLRKIITYSNILTEQQKASLTEKGQLYLEKIENASRRMSDMIEGILAYSTVSVNEQSFEVIDLNKILEGVENDLELAIIQKNAQIKYVGLPAVWGIRLLLQQLFYNLLNNALKFSANDKKPVITISSPGLEQAVSRKGKEPITYIHITVSDNGIGFNPAYAEQMFSAFSRLNSKDKYEGTGLGLALCRKIVQRHGGRIYAEGVEEEGATFHVLLPVRVK
ncbi:MAG: ATP-binding protein [Ferruginibacter sp.]